MSNSYKLFVETMTYAHNTNGCSTSVTTTILEFPSDKTRERFADRMKPAENCGSLSIIRRVHCMDS